MLELSSVMNAVRRWVAVYRTGIAIMKHNAERILALQGVEPMLQMLHSKSILENVNEIMMLCTDLDLPEDLLNENQRAFELLSNKASIS